MSTFIKLKDEAAVNSTLEVVPFDNQISLSLATIEPYIIDNMQHLEFVDLMNAYLGFSHPHQPSRPKILESLESKLSRHLSEMVEADDNTPFYEMNVFFNELVTNQIGSASIVN